MRDRAVARGPLLNLYRPTEGDGCVLWLPGQDDAQSSTIRDRSGQSHNGTLAAPTWSRLSSGLWALNFDGSDDYVTTGNWSIAAFAGLTLEMWVNKTLPTRREYLISKGYAPFQFEVWQDGSVGCEISIDSTYYNLVSAASKITATVWQHYMFTHDLATGAWAIYINGVAIVTGTRVGAAYAGSATAMSLGCHNGSGSDNTFTGKMALVRVYSITKSSIIAVDHYQKERCLFGV